MKKLLLLLFLIPNLVLGKNLSLVCKGTIHLGIEYGGDREPEPQTRTFVFEDEKLIHGDIVMKKGLGEGWSCNWSKIEIFCINEYRYGPEHSYNDTLTIDRLSGEIIIEELNYPFSGSSFNGSCEVIKKKKF